MTRTSSSSSPSWKTRASAKCKSAYGTADGLHRNRWTSRTRRCAEYQEKLQHNLIVLSGIAKHHAHKRSAERKARLDTLNQQRLSRNEVCLHARARAHTHTPRARTHAHARTHARAHTAVCAKSTFFAAGSIDDGSPGNSCTFPLQPPPPEPRRIIRMEWHRCAPSVRAA